MGEGFPALQAAPEQPGMTVGGFALDAHEVTVARFRRFWSAGHPIPTSPIGYPGGSIAWTGSVAAPTAGDARYNWDPAAGREFHPINGVDWWTALAFCAWDGGRLPTEAEWEYAARGRTTGGLMVPRVYPWGNATPVGGPSTTCDRAQWNLCPGEDGAITRRVGSFADSDRIYDLAGNVWEWMADSYAVYSNATCWNMAHLTDPLCNTSPGGGRTFRSGSSDDVAAIRSASRYSSGSPTYRSFDLGFRCARSSP